MWLTRLHRDCFIISCCYFIERYDERKGLGEASPDALFKIRKTGSWSFEVLWSGHTDMLERSAQIKWVVLGQCHSRVTWVFEGQHRASVLPNGYLVKVAMASNIWLQAITELWLATKYKSQLSLQKEYRKIRRLVSLTIPFGLCNIYQDRIFPVNMYLRPTKVYASTAVGVGHTTVY